MTKHAALLALAVLVALSVGATRAQTGQTSTYGPGTYTVPLTTLASGSSLRGAGPGITVLVGTVTAGNYAQNAGTGSTNGAAQFSISDLTIQGNVTLYGYGWTLRDVTIRGCLSAEWASGAASPGPDSMEAFVSDIKVSGCAGDGITWNGPHDSLLSNVVTFQHGGVGLRVGPNGAGSQFDGLHAWGNAGGAAVIAGTGVTLTNVQLEGLHGPMLLIQANDANVSGAQVFGSGVGVQIGDTTHAVAGSRLSLHADTVSPALVLANDAGSTWVDLLAYQGAGGVLVSGVQGVQTIIQAQQLGVVWPPLRVPASLGQ